MTPDTALCCCIAATGLTVFTTPGGHIIPRTHGKPEVQQPAAQAAASPGGSPQQELPGRNLLDAFGEGPRSCMLHRQTLHMKTDSVVGVSCGSACDRLMF